VTWFNESLRERRADLSRSLKEYLTVGREIRGETGVDGEVF
jgi:hypothetical protein